MEHGPPHERDQDTSRDAIDALLNQLRAQDRELVRLRSQLADQMVELQQLRMTAETSQRASAEIHDAYTRLLRSRTFRYTKMLRVFYKPALRIARPLIRRLRARPAGRQLVEPALQLPKTGIGPAEFGRLIRQASPDARPLDAVRISIVTPTWNTPLHLLTATVRSVLAQTTTAWEWLLVDDGSTDPALLEALALLDGLHERIRVKKAKHGGISAASNEALAMAAGEYVCFLDHDDALAPDAVATMIETLDAGWDAAYSDENKIDPTGRFYEEPFHKPDWSPTFFRGVMYVGHFLAVRRRLAIDAGGFNSEFDGVQDFELMLRVGENTDRIAHVPRVLYHWRRAAGSVALASSAKDGIGERQCAAVEAHLERIGLAATAVQGAQHRVFVSPLPRREHPLVSIVIPTKDAPAMIARCLDSIYTLTSYPKFEVVLVDNGTRDVDALRAMDRYPAERIVFPEAFNYSRANNLGAARARGDYLVFLNNDTEVVTPGWIDELLFHAEQPDVGAVGALLLYPDRTVQHAGVVLGFRGTADHVMRGLRASDDGYFGSLTCAREVSAVTAACMMVSAKTFEGVGGFNEHYATHYQDVELCLALRGAGFRNVVTPRAVLIHHEMTTRSARYDHVDRMLLLDRWQEQIDAGDPYYNPNFDLAHHSYLLKAR